MMNKLERKRYEMLVRVKDFAASRPDQFLPETPAGHRIATIVSTLTELGEQGSEKTSRKNDSRAKQNRKTDTREALREDLLAISRTARALSVRHPELAEKFKISKTMTDVALVTTARAFAREALSYRDEFIAFELPPDFIEHLNADATEFEAAISERNTAAEHVSSASNAIETGIARGMEAVMQLDAILKNRYRNDAGNLNAWLRASHVERIGRATAAPEPVLEQSAAAAAN